MSTNGREPAKQWLAFATCLAIDQKHISSFDHHSPSFCRGGAIGKDPLPQAGDEAQFSYRWFLRCAIPQDFHESESA